MSYYVVCSALRDGWSIDNFSLHSFCTLGRAWAVVFCQAEDEPKLVSQSTIKLACSVCMPPMVAGHEALRLQVCVPLILRPFCEQQGGGFCKLQLLSP